MGAGHEGAARELARRIEAAGHDARVVDFLDAFPPGLGAAWKAAYLLQLRRFPESYERSYQLFYHRPELWKPFVWFERRLAGGRTFRWIDEWDPDVVVSTYSFATLVLGELRAEGRMRGRTANFLTDFAVHPRAVHPSIDLHLAVHAAAAAKARTYVDAPVIVAGPAVHPSFTGGPVRRAAARARFGYRDEEKVILVSAGSWGIATDLVETVRTIAAHHRFRPVVLCGTDTRLKASLEQFQVGDAIGWTNEVSDHLAAADVVVENAGGLTSLEAFASGVPIVSYRPIPGHGRDNVSVMVDAGVTRWPRTEGELLRALDELGTPGQAREGALAAVASMFDDDPARHILDLAEGVEPSERR
jgi:UDP-N-acetylglucosamine:LPS N-acetylglucosamine transferase